MTRLRDQGLQLFSIKWPGDADWTLQQVQNHLLDKPYLALEHDGKLASLLLYKKACDIVEVYFLLTMPKFRRQGRMAQLLRELMRQNPGATLWLEVSDRNQPALKMYRKLGFQNKGLRPRYYLDGADSLLLERVC